ncbi:predicted protein [Nematostella vectensis]|uniref:UspA domain-containing protein n=1 Tax=Nematostella vectensis TaxID=45351 RepID=A7SDJ5_NEMVE|nr:predicted protein [Nematostella vectensis]|eukprot:XP_001630301.1 predicted protein [Nematostella vectensis]
MSKTESILFPVDGSDHSSRAFDYYLDKVKRADDQVLLAHIVEPTGIPTPTLAHGVTRSRAEWDTIMRRMEETAREITADYEKICEAENIPFQSIWGAGNAGEGICELAKNEGADFILIGNRGLGSIKRTLLGSVTDYVVQHSHVAVLIVPPK